MMFKAFPTVLLLVCLCTEVAARLQVVRVDDYIDANDESSKALKQESFDILLQEDSNSALRLLLTGNSMSMPHSSPDEPTESAPENEEDPSVQEEETNSGGEAEGSTEVPPSIDTETEIVEADETVAGDTVPESPDEQRGGRSVDREPSVGANANASSSGGGLSGGAIGVVVAVSAVAAVGTGLFLARRRAT